MSPLIGAVGDVHGDFEALAAAMASAPQAVAWLSVGDVASDDGRYPDPPAPLFFIKGNNENFDLLAQLAASGFARGNLHYLPNATCAAVGDIRVAGLGGTFAPSWYDTPAAQLPYPGLRDSRGRAVRDDKRRHFVRDEVLALSSASGVDILLTHEAARPFVVETGRGRMDAGKTPINEVLASMTPRLHLFGHHHRSSESVRQGIRSIGLDVVSRGHLLIDTGTWEVRLTS